MQDFLQKRPMNEVPRWSQLSTKILSSGKFAPETFLAIFKFTAPPVELKANNYTDKLLCQLRRHKHRAALLSIVVLRCAYVVQRGVVFGLRVSTLACIGICGCLFIPDKDNSPRHQ